MQNKNEIILCWIALQMKVLLTNYKNPGPNPAGIRDLRQGSNVEVQKQLKIESLKSEYFTFCVTCRSASNEILNGERLLCYRSLIGILNGLEGTDSM